MESGTDASSPAGPSRTTRCVAAAAATLLAACGPDLSPASMVLAPTELPIRDAQPSELWLEAPATAPLLISVAGRGVDLKAALVVAGGAPRYCDAPNRRMGVETLLVPAPHTGRIGLRILRNDHGGAAGTVTVEALALPQATEDDRRRIDAAAAETAGCLAFPALDRGGESASAFAAAAALWRKLGDDRRRGLALLHEAGAHYQRGSDWLRSSQRAAAAHSALERAGAREHAAFALRVEGAALNELAASSGFDPRRRDPTLGRARDCLTEAAQRLRALGMAYEAGYALNYRGVTLVESGQRAPARSDFQQALALLREAGDGPAQAVSLQSLAVLEHEDGRPLEAIRLFDQALALIPKHEEPANYAHTLHSSAPARRLLGRFDEAIARYHEAAEILGALGDRDGEARALHGIGTTLHYLGESDRAAELLRTAVRLRAETGSRREQAHSLLVLGSIEREAGRIAAASAIHGQALALFTSAHDRAQAHLALARDHLASGAPARARAQLESLLALELPATHRHLGLGYAELAALEAEAGAAQASERLFARALAIQEANGSELDLAQTLTRRAAARIARTQLPAAAADLERALALFRGVGLDSLPAESQAAYRASYRHAIELHIERLLRAADSAGGRGDRPEAQRLRLAALAASDEARARLLADGDRGAAGPPDRALLEERQRVYEALAAKRQQHDRLIESADPDRSRVSQLMRDIGLLRTQAGFLDARIAQGRDPRAADPASAASLMRSLPAGMAAVEFFIGPERSWAFSIRDGELAVRALPGAGEIARLARALHLAWRSSRPDAGDRLAPARALAAVLYPDGAAAPTQGLVIVPDGALHLVPMALLAQLAWPGLPPGAVTLIPSLAAFGAPAADRKPDQTLALIADPVYGRDDPRIRAGAPDAGRAADAPRRLHGSGAEAQVLLGLVADSAARLALIGPDATRRNVIDAALGRYRIVHFATHASADSRDPALATLQLSSWNRDGQGLDGTLRLYDITQLRLSAELVVLSGCDTAIGREIAGEGPVGLSHAFLRTGARSVLATLWQVPDTATAAFMSEFYRRLLVDGRSAGAALQLAQARLRREPRWSDPYFWAGFQLVTNARPGAGNNNDVAGREES